MAAVDVYAITDKLLQVLATRLEARGQHLRFQAMLTEYLDGFLAICARVFSQTDPKSWSDERGGGRGMGRRTAGRFAGWSVFQSVQLLQLHRDATPITPLNTCLETTERCDAELGARLLVLLEFLTS
jgi:hypothetical protein